MRVIIECNGVFSGLCGPERTVEISGARATVADALAALEAEVPEAAAHLPRTACALGDALVSRDTELGDGDRLALIPPVSGGSEA